jgi:mono/diheme cytochrome c family protein
MKKLLFFASFVLTVFNVSAQQWNVPEDKKARLSPVQFNAETVKKGEVIFQRNCQSCHGIPTKNNFVNLTPPPGDPATDKFQKQTDGALFYKITTGRSPMPTFKDILTEEERWAVISYFRSFNKNYVQPVITATKQMVLTPLAILSIAYLNQSQQIQVMAVDTLKEPIKGAEIALFVKRYFGNLQIGEAATTNGNGIALFDFPKDIPGDKTGNIELIAKLSSDKGPEAQKVTTLSVGLPTNKPSLTEPRAMWNVGKKAPIWLLLAYTLVVVGVWGFLFYIGNQLYRLRKMNRKEP